MPANGSAKNRSLRKILSEEQEFAAHPGIHGMLRSGAHPPIAMPSVEMLIARIRQHDAVLMLRMQAELPLDPGHWMLPVVRRVESPAAPHPKLCGFPTAWSASLQALLQSLQLDLDKLENLSLGSPQQSPAWRPADVTAQVVDISLRADAPSPRQPGHSSELRWYSRDQWQQQFARGEMLLNPLSRLLLEQPDRRWDQLTQEEPLAGVHVLPVRSNTLPPASHTNAFVIGEAPRLLVDPSPANETAYADLRDRLTNLRPDAILITHHHPDHHQLAPRLARELKLPIWCSEDTHWRIPTRFGTDYWDGIETRTVASGEALTCWLGHPVRAHAVPGHDAGQLALAPDNRAWMIVGDLIQGIGTVVIAEPEGDMGRYFESLQWVIDQDPAVIIPSHGQAMGSSFRIAETLRHRQLREEQVLQLHHAGNSMEEMLETIYQGVDRRLWGLARMNIRSHLRKLEHDGRL